MNITIGQYYPVKSYIHSLDPRVKLISTAAFICAVFLGGGFTGYLFSALFLWIVITASRVPVKLFLKGLKNIIFVVLFTVALNIFFVRQGRVIFELGFIKITLGGVLNAVKLAIRLTLLIMGSSVLTLTTSPIALTDAIEYVLKPFKKIGVPAHEIAMMMSIALRFIPTLIEELDKIKKAQTSRGADFETGGIRERAKNLIPLLTPLFISAFRRADELALAMEARCYRGDVNRTKMKRMTLEKADYKAIAVMALFIAVIGLTRLFFKLGVLI